MNNDIFKERSNKKHNNFYDYSLSNYVGNNKPVEIICPIHGVFKKRPDKHMVGQGCPKCSKISVLDNDIFKERSNKKHNNFYDYSLVNYKNGRTKVEIICPIHGVFEQKAESHMSGAGCPKCKKHYEKNKQHLYILFDKKYNIHKIGVSIDVNRRCRELNSKYYSGGNTIIILEKFNFLGELEQKIFSIFIKNKIKHPTYNKNERSDGRTEWISIDNINEIINYINNEKDRNFGN